MDVVFHLRIGWLSLARRPSIYEMFAWMQSRKMLPDEGGLGPTLAWEGTG